ncbi:histidine phosphatase superfamily [Apodospora peruviana]|uniref:Histidine phosphatase superfamily n=1 Tax=Apodospora peruviana TaxID=516989 RepID=A0AAE0ICF7_9PEZI|nr:histidine phosphatase superfamily [Apodospora peruviana]
MPLEFIYVTRHGFRSNWLVDPSSGNYTAMLKSPTGIAADPALTAHGVDQARELGERLLVTDPPIERIYSSPYYRCLQTIEPFVRKALARGRLKDAAQANVSSEEASITRVRGETGLGEWYGSAPFEHPIPAAPEVLRSLFPALLSPDYKPAVVPTRMGESIDELHNRVAATMEALISECDRDGVRAVLLCSHAAVVIALGRVLTGAMPENIEVEDFRAFTCGLSIYRRRQTGPEEAGGAASKSSVKTVVSAAGVGRKEQDAKAPFRGPHWRCGRGVAGGWDCELNSDCSHLSGGEERGWRFAGDESFASVDKSILDAGIQLGVVVEGKKKGPRTRPKEPGGPHL